MSEDVTRPDGPPAQARTTQSVSAHQPAPATDTDLTSSLRRIAAALKEKMASSLTGTVFGIDGSPAQSEEE